MSARRRSRSNAWKLPAVAVVAGVIVGGIGYAVVTGDGDERGERSPSTTTESRLPETSARPGDPCDRSPTQTIGLFPGHPNDGGIDAFEQFEDALNCSISYMVQFGDARSVEGFLRNLAGQFASDRLGQWSNDEPPFRLVYSLPLAFGDRYDGTEESARSITEQWELLVAGDDDRTEVYLTAARRLVEAGFGDAIVRVGWEFDGVSRQWYAGIDPELFQQGFRTVVDLFRSVSPHFQFDYNFLVTPNPELLEQAYPGDDYVDVIGLDIYDKGYTGPGGVPNGAEVGWSDPQRVWDDFHLDRLETHLEFARRHGKPVSFPEWGLAGGANAGGDNPVFVENMYSWIDELAGPEGPGVLYHSYFDVPGRSDGPHDLDSYPESRSTFLDLFGA